MDKSQIKDWEQLNSAIGILGKIESDMAALLIQKKDDMTKIRDQFDSMLVPLYEEHALLLADIKLFCEKHKDEIVIDDGKKKIKSKKLLTGTVGWKTSEFVEIPKDEQEVASKLLNGGNAQCVTFNVIKKTLWGLPKTYAKKLGIIFREVENFICTPL